MINNPFLLPNLLIFSGACCKMDEVVALLKDHLSKSKVREKELASRIDRLLEELVSLKEALLLKGKCSCFLVLMAKDFNS